MAPAAAGYLTLTRPGLTWKVWVQPCTHTFCCEPMANWSLWCKGPWDTELPPPPLSQNDMVPAGCGGCSLNTA